MFSSIHTCQNKVSADQYHVIIHSQPYTVNACRVQVENGLENVFFVHFSLVLIQFDIP